MIATGLPRCWHLGKALVRKSCATAIPHACVQFHATRVRDPTQSHAKLALSFFVVLVLRGSSAGRRDGDIPAGDCLRVSRVDGGGPGNVFQQEERIRDSCQVREDKIMCKQCLCRCKLRLRVATGVYVRMLRLHAPPRTVSVGEQGIGGIAASMRSRSPAVAGFSPWKGTVVAAGTLSD